MSTWKGIAVKHSDGREGRITSEFEGFGHRLLTIEVAGLPDSHVQLNAWGKDSGDPGWEWYCEQFDGGARWLPLGDQNI
jgi:hypothetical protein